MNALWDARAPLTPGEVNERLPDDRPLAYTTVMTILVRLYAKGTVTRERRGRAWAYTPIETRSEHVASDMARLLRESGDSPAALTQLVEKMTGRERTTLRRLLERQRGAR